MEATRRDRHARTDGGSWWRAAGAALSILFTSSCYIVEIRPPTPSPSPTPEPTRPAALSPDVAAAFDAALQRVGPTLGTPGVAAAVVLPSGDVWAGAHGLANLEDQRPLTPDSLFLIGDAGRVHIGAAALRLIDDGTIALDDPIDGYLEGVDVEGVTSAVRVRHLLNDTSGLDNFGDDPRLTQLVLGGQRLGPHEVLDYVGAPHAEPGERWQYAETNMYLLGLVLERASATPYFELLAAEVARPLGLERVFPDPEAQAPTDLAEPHADLDGDGTPSVVTGEPARNRLMMARSPYMLLTVGVAEEALVMDARFRGDYLSAPTRQSIMADAVRANVPPWGSVRVGLTVMETDYFHAGRAVGAGWAGFGYVGNAWHFPELGITVAALVNEGPGPQPEIAVEALAEVVRDWGR